MHLRYNKLLVIDASVELQRCRGECNIRVNARVDSRVWRDCCVSAGNVDSSPVCFYAKQTRSDRDRVYNSNVDQYDCGRNFGSLTDMEGTWICIRV